MDSQKTLVENWDRRCWLGSRGQVCDKQDWYETNWWLSSGGCYWVVVIRWLLLCGCYQVCPDTSEVIALVYVLIRARPPKDKHVHGMRYVMIVKQLVA